MDPPFPSATRTWHNDTYPAIDPRRPENSQAGKTVIITGAGSGIGRSTALAFTAAGAAHLILIGRTESTLRETQAQVQATEAQCRTTVCVASVSDYEQMKGVAECLGEGGKWDVLILNAGHLAKPRKVHDADMEDWWASYETNCKSILIVAQLFVSLAAPANASLIAITAGGVVLPPAQMPGLSAYFTSKTAQVKLMEWLGVENPNLFTCSLHPGVVDTKMLRESDIGDGLPPDTPELPAHFLVWLARPESGTVNFLEGKFVWTNWDVEELCAKKGEIAGSSTMTVNSLGWPYEHGRTSLVDHSG